MCVRVRYRDINFITLVKNVEKLKMLFTPLKLPSLLSGVITLLCIIFMSHFDHCASQRNPPQGASRSGNNPNVYTYGRGDIPIFNGPGTGPLAQLRELIIAIR